MTFIPGHTQLLLYLHTGAYVEIHTYTRTCAHTCNWMRWHIYLRRFMYRTHSVCVHKSIFMCTKFIPLTNSKCAKDGPHPIQWCITHTHTHIHVGAHERKVRQIRVAIHSLWTNESRLGTFIWKRFEIQGRLWYVCINIHIYTYIHVYIYVRIHVLHTQMIYIYVLHLTSMEKELSCESRMSRLTSHECNGICLRHEWKDKLQSRIKKIADVINLCRWAFSLCSAVHLTSVVTIKCTAIHAYKNPPSSRCDRTLHCESLKSTKWNPDIYKYMWIHMHMFMLK